MATPSPYARFIEALESRAGARPGDKGNWRCPAHEDNQASLSVTEADDHRVLVHCHAGCTADQVCAALGLRLADLMPQSGNGHHVEVRSEFPPGTKTYVYTDATGQPLYRVVRLPPKDFKQQRWDVETKSWQWGIKGVKPVPYRLPELIAAARAGGQALNCEGEKDCETARAAGLVATCNSGGAGKWQADFARYFKGLSAVYVVADQDLAGAAHAEMVAASVCQVVPRTFVVAPKAGKDLTDHVTAGFSVAEIMADPSALKRSLLGDIISEGVTEPDMVHPWIYASSLVTLQSQPGFGKTFLALWWAIQMIRRNRTVVYLDEEGGERLVAERLAALGIEQQLVDERFFYFPFPARKWTTSDLANLHDVMLEAERVMPVAAVFLDSLPDFLAIAGLSEDSAMDVTGFVDRLLPVVRDFEAALIVLDHLNKPEGNEDSAKPKRRRSRYSRGSGAKLAKADLTLLLEAHEEFSRYKSGKLLLWATKDRKGYIPLPRVHEDGHEIVVNVDVRSGHIEFKAGDMGWIPTRCRAHILDALTKAAGQPIDLARIESSIRGIGHEYKMSTLDECLMQMLQAGIVTGIDGGWLIADGVDVEAEKNRRRPGDAPEFGDHPEWW